jgi:hypothetical protein
MVVSPRVGECGALDRSRLLEEMTIVRPGDRHEPPIFFLELMRLGRSAEFRGARGASSNEERNFRAGTPVCAAAATNKALFRSKGSAEAEPS